MRNRALVVLPALVLTSGALAACGSSSKTAGSASPSTTTAGQAAAGIACTPDLTTAATASPPSDVPFVPGGVTYLSKGPFGTTSLYFQNVEADPTNLDATRDKAVATLTAAGYTVQRKDQEEGSEAEAVLVSTAHTVAIQVIQLCAGHVRVKYTLTPGATPSPSASASTAATPSASAAASASVAATVS